MIKSKFEGGILVPYTAKEAMKVMLEYLNSINATYEFIENTKNRGLIIHIDNMQRIVIFVSPLVHKADGTKNYFDTRDSSPDARELAWNYAKENDYKYFCIGINDSVAKYENYFFSLEADEKYIEKISGTIDGIRVGKGNQIIIPNNYSPKRNFERIKNRLSVYISVIHKDFLKEYLTVYDNRPYVEHSIQIENEVQKGTFVCKFSTNILLYGVPGCGKSYFVEQEYESQITNSQCKVRVVFHPDYTYSDFVGQIMPALEIKNEENDEAEEKLTYKFVEGPFTRIMRVAKENPTEKCLLIIEELNRGNAPAIFGEVFQLLDRGDDGYSKYAIYNRDISKELYGKDHPNEPIKLPPNLTIIATMNTSDQNVFTMDTAFQRRWQMKHIPNRFYGTESNPLSEATKNHVAKKIPASKISWGVFATTVNSKMGKASLGFAGTEDKSLGVYFATDKELDSRVLFAEKVLKYLWDDAFKMARNELFKDHDKSLSYVIEMFEEAEGDPLKSVLSETLYKEMVDKQNELLEPYVDEEDNDSDNE